MLDLSNVTENLFGAILPFSFEHLSHMLENSGELCDMFGQGKYLLVRMYHDIGRLVKSRRYRCPEGSDGEDAGDEANLGHCVRSTVSVEKITILACID